MGETRILTDKAVVTRKDHRCAACGKLCPKGSRMQSWSGLNCGDFYSSRMPVECAFHPDWQIEMEASGNEIDEHGHTCPIDNPELQ